MNASPLTHGGRARWLWVDAAKGLAALAIMLHHFSIYGPVSRALRDAFPVTSGVLADYGRYAVQVFLVLGGYLAAEVLMRHPERGLKRWLHLVLQRWWRLAVPLMAAVMLTLVAHAMTARVLPELLPERVSLAQLAVHALLLQDVLRVEALTVGAWYVAIDWQLYALLSLILVATPISLVGVWRWVPVGVLLLVSLWHFNRDDAWDAWGLYFFGSYGLGSVCAWALHHRPRRARAVAAAAFVMALVVLVALAMDYRERLLVAGVTALGLLCLQGIHWMPGPPLAALWRFLGKHSYALFLVHFSICIWANALFVVGDQGRRGAAAVLGSVMLMSAGSIALATGFHRWVEQPLARVFLRRS